MGSRVNRASAATATTGTGAVTPGAATQTYYRTWAASGIVTNAYYDYLIEDGNAWEIGVGLYNGTTITRPGPGVDPFFDSSTGSLLNLSGSAKISCVDNKNSFGMALLLPPNTLGSAGTVSLSNIPPTFNNLKVVATGRTVATDSAVSNLGVIFNGDTTAAHYSNTFYFGNFGSGTIGPSSTYGAFTGGAFASSASGNTVDGIFVLDIPNYSRSQSLFVWEGSNTAISSGRSKSLIHGHFNPGSATTITSLTITGVDGSLVAKNLAAGFTTYVYGY